MTLNEVAIGVLRMQVEEFVRKVEEFGFVVTVEQRPLTPLAMGNYTTTVSVRRKRANTIETPGATS